MRRGRDERGEGAADGKARPIFSGGERSEACVSRRQRVQKLEPRAHSVESSRVHITRSLAASRNCSSSASQRRRATHSPPRAPGRAHPGASRESPSRVYSEAARFLETASVPAGERGERGGQRGRTTDGTGTNDRRAKRATRRPTGPTSLPRRRTQARLERSGNPCPLGTVAREYAPSRNPFLKRRGRVLRYLMRPVPVVRRPMAFVDQLSVSAAEGGESQSPGFLEAVASAVLLVRRVALGSRHVQFLLRAEG